MCRELDALYPELQKPLEDDAVLFVKLDLSNDKTIKHTELLVSALGIQKDWDDMAGGTGLINVIDAKTKKRVAQLNVTHSAETMAEIIREHLK